MYLVLGYVVLFVIIVIGNLGTVLAVILSRQLLRINSNYLILSLAISDLFIGHATLYDLILHIHEDLNTKIACILRYVFLCVACTASLYNVTAIAIDRFIAIVYPFKYLTYVTRKVVLVMIAINWSAAILISVVPIFWNHYDTESGCSLSTVIPSYFVQIILIPNFVIVWVSMFFLYWKIWRKARAHTQRSKIRSKETGQRNSSSYNKSNQYQPSLMVNSVTDWIAMCNCGINPLIYAWKNSSFRQAYRHSFEFKPSSHDDCARTSKYDNRLSKESSDGVNHHKLCTGVVSKTVSFKLSNEIRVQGVVF
ncbi:5-hydroxytryptamine receptor 1-like [Copidosoma floridanum]|uniref:5-hydroxytryptamine receptor 1-like n=1 Tax=Copidosoma floridanum TaxID=29053 RepID=UPI000C6F5730|nr:5-hydroxytryptamine receptor 1-like [Copidosoma floridanum]